MEIASTIHEKYFIEFIYSLNHFKEHFNDKNILIHFQYNNFESDKHLNIVFNTEQLSIEHWKHKMYIISLYHPLLDYSYENIKILKSLNPNSRCLHFPILFNPKDMIFNYNLENCEYDVVFMGCMTDRRNKILNSLKSKNINILIISDTYDYLEKYKLILKAKILLNLHAFEDYKIFEFARCSIPIYNSQIVISENSIDSLEESKSVEESGHLNSYILAKVIFTDYDDVENKVVEVLNNIDKYKLKIDYKELIERTKNEIELINNFLNKC